MEREEQPGKFLILVQKLGDFTPVLTKNPYANDIIMSYDTTHKQIYLYKQAVVSQLPYFKSHSGGAVSG